MMLKLPLRVYVDTSVFGGVYDDEFALPSRRFFDMVAEGRFTIIVSALVSTEIQNAPTRVQEFFSTVLQHAEVVDVEQGTLQLMKGYLDANIVTPQWRDDALHVALATAAGCSMIVSWNFKHIVHYRKIPRYNAVNVLHGYTEIAIYSPLEVIADEEDV